MIKKFVLTSILASFVYSTNLFAGGFEIPIHSIKLIGIGNAGSALSLDAGCLQFNSSNMAFLKNRTSINIGVINIAAGFTLHNNSQNLTQNNNMHFSLVPNAFVTDRISDNITVGLSVMIKYGAGIDWGNNFSLSGIASEVSLRTYNPALHIAYKLNDNFSVGAQVGFTYLEAEFKRNLKELTTPLATANNAFVKISGSGMNFSAGASLAYLSKDKTFQAGLSYNYIADIDSRNGKATLNNVPNGYQNFVPNGNISTTIKLPHEINLGAAKKINNFLLAASIAFYTWDNFKSFAINFKDAPFAGTENGTNKAILNLKNSFHYNVGVQYDIKDKYFLRGGASYSNSVANKDYLSPMLPIDDNISLHSGFTYRVSKKIDIDATYLLGYGLGISGQNLHNGIETISFRSLINIFGVGFCYSL